MLTMTINKLAKITNNYYTPQALYKKIKSGKWLPDTNMTGKLILPAELEEAVRRGKEIRWHKDILENSDKLPHKHIKWVMWAGELIGIIENK